MATWVGIMWYINCSFSYSDLLEFSNCLQEKSQEENYFRTELEDVLKKHLTNYSVCLDEQFSLISKALEKFLKKKEMKYTVSDEVDEGQLPIAYSMIIIFLTKKLVETVEEYRENSRINYDNDDEKAMIIFFWITVLERLRKHKNSIDIILIKDSKLDSSIMVQNGNKILGLDDLPIYDIQSKKDQNQILNCLTHTTRGDKNWKISSAV
ncbi:uncharacterized protein TRIADDRAFT_61638 [Trichoplax adhaerens]|uniref:Uncharacterized protein n=1 Tax=Trichoplax adhaerens TaxID=10228 RepID=B3SBJ5_TRIAD|nr:predicted protein [Trichoplax adhaerens]EDV19866.1 predicted protein [Trichoplax adhaerens]|eukprot:XP_002117608.1 predicted protein [Trichoplax adhaerens]